MIVDESWDVLPDDPRWGHAFGPGADGVRIHYVRGGQGPPVLLLHGWPGFWYDWRRVIPRLADAADLIVPDLRGFGDSDKPTGPPTDLYTPAALTADMLALLDHLGLESVVVAAYDIGARVAQTLARQAPARVRALVLCSPAYPGIGMRRYEPGMQPEFWYQHFHSLPLAARLAGYNRDTVELYLRHFYDHWVNRTAAIRPKEFAAIVDTYARPGAFAASIAYYQAMAARRLAEATTSDPAAQQIAQPAYILWGADERVFPLAWADRLADYFPRLTFRPLPGVGHFLPLEAPDAVADAVRAMLT
jgi:pimeloyl-ACP methyl ester carboxylesterase